MTKAEKRQMLDAFDKFASRIWAQYHQAYAALERDDYVKAHEILSALAMSHAKTSLSLRNKLVKEGLMKD